MSFCTNCGYSIPEWATTCPACGRAQDAPETSPTTATQADEGPKSPMRRCTSGSFMLADGEQLVKKYNCVEVKKPISSEGCLYVTNKRVLFAATGNGSRLYNEVSLDSVSGVSSFYGTNCNFKMFAIGVFCLCFGLMGLTSCQSTNQAATYYGTTTSPIASGFGMLGLLFLVAGGFLMYNSFRKNFTLRIYSSKATGSPIEFGGGPSSIIGNGALLALAGEPTEATDRMLNELGAMIQDLQTYGDHAISRWRKA